MTKSELIDQSKDVFKSHPSVNELYMTNDGLAFLNKKDAQGHARSYDLQVETVKRAEALPEVKAKEPPKQEKPKRKAPAKKPAAKTAKTDD